MFAQRLKQLRTERQVSQSELATVLNISNRTISMYEQGNSEPNVETLIKIANYFNVTTDYLIGLSEGKTTDLQKLYEEIGLSEASIDYLKMLTTFKNEHSNPTVLKLSPLDCIDFCLSNYINEYSLFDSIYSYFLAHIPDGQAVYISETGQLSLKPEHFEAVEICQSIPSEYLENAILQEILDQLRQFKKLYQETHI
ncbi:MAG: helix-turn-helix transcriptional regulator [Lachnospiraceae bacterium]|nr:helix-turn-helix transcriptional regulator [Lachnospiraceae bacterium]